MRLCHSRYLNTASGIKIYSNKIDEFAFYIILKATFAKNVDNDKSDFKLGFYFHIRKASKFSVRDNQT